MTGWQIPTRGTWLDIQSRLAFGSSGAQIFPAMYLLLCSYYLKTCKPALERRPSSQHQGPSPSQEDRLLIILTQVTR